MTAEHHHISLYSFGMFHHLCPNTVGFAGAQSFTNRADAATSIYSRIRHMSTNGFFFDGYHKTKWDVVIILTNQDKSRLFYDNIQYFAQYTKNQFNLNTLIHIRHMKHIIIL